VQFGLLWRAGVAAGAAADGVEWCRGG